MKVIKDFFNNLNLPKQDVPNGSSIWYNPKSDTVYNKRMHLRYYPLPSNEIQDLEDDLNRIYHTQVVFPQWYKDLLSYANGIDLFFGAISLYGKQTISRTDPLHESPYSLYMENLGKNKKLGKDVFLIGSYGYDRTGIAIDTSKEGSRIFCVYDTTDEIICEWASFEEFFSSETERLQKLYDMSPWGKLKKGVKVLPDGHKEKK